MFESMIGIIDAVFTLFGFASHTSHHNTSLSTSLNAICFLNSFSKTKHKTRDGVGIGAKVWLIFLLIYSSILRLFVCFDC